MKKVSVALQGHRTSFSLEEPFLQLLRALADEQALSLAQLVAQIDRARLSQAQPPNLSSALRLFVLQALVARSQDSDAADHQGPFARALQELAVKPA
jgi:predicted DNA-binding ribbon-helix-helix protein